MAEGHVYAPSLVNFVIIPQKRALPPFRAEDCAAVAYVSGRYARPGPRFGALFLGLYYSSVGTRFSFWIFTASGRPVEYSAASRDDACVEFALIWGAIRYDIPFAQWRPYRVGRVERQVLRELKLGEQYERVRRTLAEVLFHARMPAYLKTVGIDWRDARKPWFVLRSRSLAAIRRDTAERDEIMKRLGLRW